MKKAYFIAALLLHQGAFAHDYWCLDKHVTFYADYGYIRRSEIRKLPLVQKLVGEQPLDGPLNTETALYTTDLARRLGWESAYRFGVLLHCGACSTLEATYTYYCPWSASEKVSNPGSLRFPFKFADFGVDYENADAVAAKYRSRLQNAELNYWGHVTPQRIDYFSFSYVVGARGFYLDEDMTLAFTKGDNLSDYKTDTENWLYGLQLGALLEINPNDCWSWGLGLKGGIFYNQAENKVNALDQNNTVVLQKYTKHGTEVGYLIEGIGKVAWHLNSYLSIHGSYEAFLLSGLALAPPQRDISTRFSRKIKTGGQIVIDGAYGGVSLSF